MYNKEISVCRGFYADSFYRCKRFIVDMEKMCYTDGSLSRFPKEKKMGFRYRKSINLGGGFRINISKSGIGYSWGVKGYRITKTAKGTTRRTSSIPGTGLSFVEETSNKKITPNQNNIPSIDNNHYDTK